LPEREEDPVAPAPLEIVNVQTRAQWRRWLETHHASSPGIWFVFHKKHTGMPSVPYDDAVREALCFGWIDSLVKRLDDHKYIQKFTPRKPASKWSDSNRKRWAELKAAGLLAAAGIASPPTGNRYAPTPVIPTTIPSYIARAFKANRKAWTTFQSLPPGERRRYVGWIYIAKQDETRARRIRESIRLLAAGKRLGIK
jgi:uncharacterized protein YdeI (YjbR/CyaY-like superfamily)